MSWQVLEADCVEAMREMDEASVDAIVTDPPYGLEFMGKEWDRFAPQDTTARVLRKTGGSLQGDKTTPHGRTGVAGKSQPRATFRCERCGGWTGSFNETRRARQRECKCESPLIDYGRLGATPAVRAYQAFSREWAAEAIRVLKPGGHLLAFGGTRTYHRLACAVEDAGFEIRDRILCLRGGDAVELGPELDWVYGSG